MRKSKPEQADRFMLPLRPIAPLLILALGLINGCGIYQPGPGYSPPFQRIHLAPIETEALTPGFARLLDNSLRQTLHRDQRVRLVEMEQAEVILRVRLLEFSEDLSAFSPEDTGRPVSMRNRIIARVDLGPPAEPTALLHDRRVESQVRLFSPDEPAFQASRFQSQPALAAQLAERIRDTVLRAGD